MSGREESESPLYLYQHLAPSGNLPSLITPVRAYHSDSLLCCAPKSTTEELAFPRWDPSPGPVHNFRSLTLKG